MTAPAVPSRPARDGAAQEDRLWYLYGVTRRAALGATLGAGLYGAPVQALPVGDLAALVSLAPHGDFDATAIQSRLDDPFWLATMAQGHQEAVAACHRESAVLPAKFGCVYAAAEQLIAALSQQHDALLAVLGRLDGCDEWGLRLYADREVMRQGAGDALPTVARLQREMATAGPGRAYLLGRKLAGALDAAVAQLVGEAAQNGHDELLRCAVDGQVSAGPPISHSGAPDAEILRAAYLVRRAELPAFAAAVQRLAESAPGLRCEYSGPWPPYSFAALPKEDEP